MEATITMSLKAYTELVEKVEGLEREINLKKGKEIQFQLSESFPGSFEYILKIRRKSLIRYLFDDESCDKISDIVVF